MNLDGSIDYPFTPYPVVLENSLVHLFRLIDCPSLQFFSVHILVFKLLL